MVTTDGTKAAEARRLANRIGLRAPGAEPQVRLLAGGFPSEVDAYRAGVLNQIAAALAARSIKVLRDPAFARTDAFRLVVHFGRPGEVAPQVNLLADGIPSEQYLCTAEALVEALAAQP